jgi:2-polyprenyl-3-methyl-5-hydroxy-6-metoxy-1,4-benzoquinol methylase
MTDKIPSISFSFTYGGQKPQTVPVIAKPRVRFDGCPLCSSKQMSELRTVDCTIHPLYHPLVPPHMTWMRCAACEHVCTDGYFSPEVLSVIFGKTSENQRPGNGFEQARFHSARMVERVARHCAPQGRWLDVGFGNGSLLFTAEEFGFDPVGIDLRPSSVEAMHKLGFEAHCVDMADYGEDGSCSVVSMADVLEHMPFPQRGLEAARRLLKPGGILFVSMPHYNCAAWRLLDAGNGNPFWAEIEHYHNFSRRRLDLLLQDFGFDVLGYGVSERYRVCMEMIARRREG